MPSAQSRLYNSDQAQTALDNTPLTGDKNVKYSLDDITLVDENDQKKNWNLFNAVTTSTLTLSIAQASTVAFTLEDSNQDFLRDPLFTGWAYDIQDVSTSSARSYSTHKITAATNNVNAGDLSDLEWVLGQRPIDVFVGSIAFRLSRIEGDQDLLTLTFEDRAASKLRDRQGFMSATRGTVTRAQFVAKLCKQAGVPYFIPEINKVQPIAADTESQTAEDLSSSGGTAITVYDGLTCKGKPLNPKQVDILNKALAAAVSLSAPYKAQVALVCALIDESTISQINIGTAGQGPLSISSAAHYSGDPYDTTGVSTYFLRFGFTGQGGAISIAQNNPKLAAYQIAQAVQGSGAGAATDGAGNYGLWQSEAERIVKAYGGGSLIGGAVTTPDVYTFTRGPNEDSWDCIQRLASEVGWYAFVRNNQLWFVSGEYLYKAKTQIEVIRGRNGIDWINVDLDTGARDGVAEVALLGHFATWAALPGMSAYIQDEGPATGKWNIQEVTFDLADDSEYGQITLIKPLPPRPEPAADTSSSSTTTSYGGKSGTLQAAYGASQVLSNMKLPYTWGGGHQPGGLLNVHAGGPGLDCSGSVSWVLRQAGMFTSDTAWVSGDLATKWGSPGEGEQMTVWANDGHVWIEFKLPGLHMQMNTVNPGDVGPRLYAYGPPGGNTAGFTPRCWPGA